MGKAVRPPPFDVAGTAGYIIKTLCSQCGWISIDFSTASRCVKHEPGFALKGGAGQVQGEPCRKGLRGVRNTPDATNAD